MKVASISQTKNNLSALLDEVKQGETVLILDRDRPVARLEPVVRGGELDPEGRLERLERGGIVRRGAGSSAADVVARTPPRPGPGGSVLAALLEERRQGR